MSVGRLRRGAPTAALGAALTALMVSYATAQSLVDNFGARDATVLRNVAYPAAPADELAVPGDEFQRQIVSYTGAEPAGTTIIDTAHTMLYLTLGNGKALRYGIGVGRKGFTWSGVEKISRKSEWPDWIPPAEMISRQPYLPRWVGGGSGNPLGARALYLGDTDYRIHGTNNPASIGKHVSSGCIRMRDADVIDLYDRVGIGAKVVVLPNDQVVSAVSGRKELPQSGMTQKEPAQQDVAQQVAIEGAPGAMTARIAVRPVIAVNATVHVPPRAQWSDNPTAFGLY